MDEDGQAGEQGFGAGLSGGKYMRVTKNGLEGQHCVAGDLRLLLPRLDHISGPSVGLNLPAPLCALSRSWKVPRCPFVGVWTDEGLVVAYQEVKSMCQALYTGSSQCSHQTHGPTVPHHVKGDGNKVRNKIIPETGSAQ